MMLYPFTLNYETSGHSSSETPQPESCRAGPPCSKNMNNVNKMNSNNRHTTVITNIRKQKKSYKY